MLIGNIINNGIKASASVLVKPMTILAKSKPVQDIVTFATKESSPGGKTNLETVLKKYAPALAGVWLEVCYSTASLFSDKIPEKRKAPLIINLLFTGITSAIGSIALAPFVEKCQDALEKRFSKVQGISDKTVLSQGLRGMPHIIIAAVLLHYICPVIATPVASKINDFLVDHHLLKKHKDKKHS